MIDDFPVDGSFVLQSNWYFSHSTSV